MANTLLTPTAVTRKALAILHQKLNFVGNINRQYDSSFAQAGAKIGDTLRIRLPNEYTVRTGATLSAQDTDETSVALQVNNQKGVDVSFSSVELTLDLDDFAERILEPAMAVLAANIENDVMNVYKDVYNDISDLSAAISARDVLLGNKKITDSLAPYSNRCINMNTVDCAELVDDLKGLFNDPAKISKNYREGMVANQFLGYQTVYENTMWPLHTSGTNAGTGYLVNGASQTGSSLVVDTGTGTFTQGDIIQIAGVNRVHPETKQDTGKVQRFVVTADYAGGAGTVSISPAITVTGGRQNVTASPADNAAISKVESDGSTAIGNAAEYAISLGFHRDAFTFATADLEMPQGVDFSAREVYDGISMRVVRDYNINDDTFPCRIDVLYGYQSLRPQNACRYSFLQP